MNIVGITGNLAKDCEVRYEKEGKGLMVFTVAVSRSKMVNGAWVDETSFLECTYFAKLTLVQKLTKGSFVSVDGMVLQNSWVDKTSGQKRYKVIIEAKHLTVHQKQVDQNTGNPQFNNATSNENPANYNQAPPTSQYQAPPPFDEGNDCPF